MTDRELKKLSRSALLEMLIAQSTELEKCTAKLSAAETALKKRDLAIDKAGSIAEAALVLNGVFDAAQSACQQYIDNIRILSERQQKICTELETQSHKKAQELLDDAENVRKDLIIKTQTECAEMRRKAKAESQRYWDDISVKLQAFYDSHVGLRELVSVVNPEEKMI